MPSSLHGNPRVHSTYKSCATLYNITSNRNLNVASNITRKCDTYCDGSPRLLDKLTNFSDFHNVSGDTLHRVPLSHIHSAHDLLTLNGSAVLSPLNTAGNLGFTSLRFIHTSRYVYKEESKVQKTVQALKDEAQEEAKRQDIDKQEVVAPKKAESPEGAPVETKAVSVPKKSLKQRVIAEVKHYYNGFKLLYMDSLVLVKYLWRRLKGETLTRREHNQV